MKRIYAGAFGAFLFHDCTEHISYQFLRFPVSVVTAEDQETTHDYLLEVARKQMPKSDGYSDHFAIVTEVPQSQIQEYLEDHS